MPSKSLHDFPFRADSPGAILELRAGEHALASAAERKELLERVRAGEHVELEVDAITYIQRETPNRNFVRFKPGILRSLAKSGVNTPFLTDHRQRDVLARGGTVTRSVARKNDAGEIEFHQTLKLVKPWAVEGVLDGTIDKFSIAWIPTGPLAYAHSGEEIVGWPRHWPGDEIEVDGKTVIVEWMFTAAELIETSGVNVPGVVGTSVKEFRAELAAHLGGAPPRRTPAQEPEKGNRMDKEILSRLGLPESAGVTEVLAEIAKLKADLEGEQRDHRLLRDELEQERAARRAEQQAANEQRRDEALAEARELGLIDGSETGKKREEYFLSRASKDLEDAISYLETLEAINPVGRELQSNEDAPPELPEGVAVLDDARRKRMRALGITEQSYEQCAPGRFELGAIPPQGRGA